MVSFSAGDGSAAVDGGNCGGAEVTVLKSVMLKNCFRLFC